MEKFVMAAGCALRMSDSGKPAGRHKKHTVSDATATVAPDEGASSADLTPAESEGTASADSAPDQTESASSADLTPAESEGTASADSAPDQTEDASSSDLTPAEAQGTASAYSAAEPNVGVAPAECGGDDITIVLLHGYLESLDVWDDFTRLLAPHMRVITLDLPGHGISEVKGEVHTMEFLADTVHAVLELCGVKKCVVCGHSMGGYAALEFLRKYPQATSGIILFHSVPYADTKEKKEHRRREIEIVLADKKDLIAAQTFKSFAPANRKRFARAIEELSDQAFLTDDDGVLALLRGMGERRDSNSVLSRSNVPQMFIFGRGDEYITADIAADMIARHPKAQVLWLENSGHLGFIEEPDKSAQAIIRFCSTLL